MTWSSFKAIFSPPSMTERRVNNNGISPALLFMALAAAMTAATSAIGSKKSTRHSSTSGFLGSTMTSSAITSSSVCPTSGTQISGSLPPAMGRPCNSMGLDDCKENSSIKKTCQRNRNTGRNLYLIQSLSQQALAPSSGMNSPSSPAGPKKHSRTHKFIRNQPLALANKALTAI